VDSRDREKSYYYLANIPLKRSISAEKEFHGTGKICFTYQKSHLCGGPSYREYTVVVFIYIVYFGYWLEFVIFSTYEPFLNTLQI